MRSASVDFVVGQADGGKIYAAVIGRLGPKRFTQGMQDVPEENVALLELGVTELDDLGEEVLEAAKALHVFDDKP